ncbi:MAG: Murein DD-endopeptidase MepM [Alphaproteobacteria bacterium ADurb.Bin438]|nr:MAG: Murein DD-endopeptidase MepM [Alphaproteobacteria bacterium ADurb.Bin438]
MSKIKDIMKNTGYSFERFYSKAKEEIFSQGGPFIPVVSNAINDVPELKNEDFEKTSKSLYGKIDNWNTLKVIQSKLPLGKPIKTINVSAPFGNRFDPFNGEISLHEGIDLVEKEGEKVKITSPGKITYSGKMGFYGIMVEVDHGNQIKTRYAHLKTALVKKGDKVNEGDVIGEVGNTGRSTGAHLHYEVRLNGYPVNPYQFIKVKKDVFKE